MMRTHRCGELRTEDSGTEATLCGWVHSRRDHGGVTFIDLRDTSGVVQIVFTPDIDGRAHEAAQELRNEYCIRVTGAVRDRKEGTKNPRPPDRRGRGGSELLSRYSPDAETPPFQVDEHQEVDEQLRLKHRYLDLRREHMQDNLKLRHTIVSCDPPILRRRGVPRDRDSDADALDA